ncbi:MAG: NCS2 family permease [Peptostreptococcaceae bacterium]|nr:NCS2 family permease [Peptostreptococcaceae bacterium]MDY5739298.1 NCS2 family permease [Anaerovoracaceae bacterium]SFE44432.1 putative MFS transporter, AGZA family, xanthine/uracil permease [Peptostreptococcaceae bacterium pGA-8]
MENFFKLKEHGTDVKTEMVAGATTFLSMVYILAVNPSILAASGLDSGAVFTATAISAFAATLFMAFFANYPVALASGMGLNAYFSYSVCIPLAESGVTDPWQIALTAVFVEGIIFILLSFFNFREKLVNDVPENLKYGITAGIGLFIAIIGLKGAGIVAGSQATLVDLGHVSSPQFILGMAGLLIVAALHHFNVKGYILIGILGTWGLGMIAQATGWYQVDPEAGMFSLFPNFSTEALIPTAPTFFKFNFEWAGKNILSFLVIVFSFLFVDLFDTVGTLIGVAEKGNLLDKEGKLPNAKGALLADACGTVLGACLGTSTVTSYVESSAGVANGGRTGLTAVTTAVLFLIALFFAPIFLAIPAFATTPALVWVGLLMMSSIKRMKFDGDIADVFGGYMAVIMMPFTYSIANGIMFGILSWVILKTITGKAKDVPAVMWISALLFALRLWSLV